MSIWIGQIMKGMLSEIKKNKWLIKLRKRSVSRHEVISQHTSLYLEGRFACTCVRASCFAFCIACKYSPIREGAALATSLCLFLLV